MILRQSFDDLLVNKVNLNKTRIDKAISAHRGIREYLKNHEVVSKYFYDSYLQGSYAQTTAIKPVNENDYDVDVVVTLNWKNDKGELKDTTSLKKLIFSALEESGIYKDKLLPFNGKKCITLQYSEFHLDVLPAHFDNDGNNKILIIDKKNIWRESNPKDFAQWCIDKNKETDNIFKKVVRIMKYWRNIQLGEKGTPKSIVLTTIIGNNISYSNISIDQTIVETLENIVKLYDDTETVPIVMNPSLETENLARNWKTENFKLFVKKLKKATETARKALDEKIDVKTAIDLWNSKELFDGNLPNSSLSIQKDIDEARNFRNQQKSNSLFIGSSGLVGVDSGSKVGFATGTNVRHFGDNNEIFR